MSPFPHEEPPNPCAKRCKFLASTIKDAFSSCHTFCKRSSPSRREAQEEEQASDFDVEEEEVFVSAIVSKYMESKCKRKTSYTTDSFCWDFSAATAELFITEKETEQQRGVDDEEKENFFEVSSNFSCCCSNATSMDAYFSVKTSFSRGPSLNMLDFPFTWKRSIFQEFCHCQGWPFGLCRKALLLPPLPKSPSDSWSWRKSSKMVRTY